MGNIIYDKILRDKFSLSMHRNYQNSIIYLDTYLTLGDNVESAASLLVSPDARRSIEDPPAPVFPAPSIGSFPRDRIISDDKRRTADSCCLIGLKSQLLAA